jgi:hypothetical protein
MYARPSSLDFKQMRTPVLLISVAFALVLASLSTTVIGDFLIHDEAADPQNLDEFLGLLRIQRYLLWAGALVLAVWGVIRARKQDPVVLPERFYTKRYTAFLLVTAALLVAMVGIGRFAGPSLQPDAAYLAVTEYVHSCYLLLAVASILVAVLRMRTSPYAMPASTAILVFHFLVFLPAGIVGYFVWRSARKDELGGRKRDQ